MELSIDQQARGCRILFGQEVLLRRNAISKIMEFLHSYGFREIELPSIEPASLYVDKAGPEILGQMYVFNDKGGRELCLRPEGTATVQAIAKKHFKNHKDLCISYVSRCYRYERPQAGRYREFIQIGAEMINPSIREPESFLIDIAMGCLKQVIKDVENRVAVTKDVGRGLAYYTGSGFEISAPELGAQKQICGGGPYDGGIGFAIGFDRLALMLK